ncbi:MAG: hypothetical protein NC093_10065 [Alistipes sp.]|nr:hypothetical protein [Alistipes sp.]
MTLTEKFISDAIYLDAGAEIIYGSDEIFDTYPCCFPTVELQLMATDALVEVADRIRLEKGFKPMHPRDGRTDDVDNDGWYDFYIGISKLPGENQEYRLDNSITFIVANSDSDDDEEIYSIDLTADEQSIILEILNAQCRRYHGKDIAVMLAEAEKEMMD